MDGTMHVAHDCSKRSCPHSLSLTGCCHSPALSESQHSMRCAANNCHCWTGLCKPHRNGANRRNQLGCKNNEAWTSFDAPRECLRTPALLPGRGPRGTVKTPPLSADGPSKAAADFMEELRVAWELQRVSETWRMGRGWGSNLNSFLIIAGRGCFLVL